MSIFMHIEGIQGEASDPSHKGWLDIGSIGWGVDRHITAHASTQNDRESANAEMQQLLLYRRMDSATPKLFLESCCGRGKDVVIHLTKTGTGSGADVFMEYTLKNAIISSYRVNARSQGKGRPMELIGLSFAEVELKYVPYDQDGNPLAGIAVAFDASTNTKR